MGGQKIVIKNTKRKKSINLREKIVLMYLVRDVEVRFYFLE